MISMTGFGRGSATGAGIEVTVEVQSVNRRNLETIFSLPKEWAALEPVLTELVKGSAQRGRIQTTVTFHDSTDSAGLHWDESELQATLIRLRRLAESVGTTVWAPSEDMLLRLVLALQSHSKLAPVEAAQPLVLEAAQMALDGFTAMRAREGQAIAKDLQSRVGELKRLLQDARNAAEGRVESYRELLFTRLKNAGLELDLNDERVLKEIALFADRCDVSEEMTRLQSHLAQFSDTISRGSEQAVGRKLEFILQEILREFNTIGSKSNNLVVTRQVIEAKNEIERIREQIQNAE